jgi:hypothetical protein
MALSTEGLLGLTLWQTVIGGFGLGALVVTILLTVRATNAAIDANRIARESAERQLRAYIFVDSCKRTQEDKYNRWFIEASFKNFGQTPAYKLTIKFDYKLVSAPEAETMDFCDPTKHSSVHDLGPGHQTVVRPQIHELTGTNLPALKDGNLGLFFWGRADFIDAFGKERWLRFRYFQAGGKDLLSLGTHHEGNSTSESECLT